MLLSKLTENEVAYYFDPVCPWTWKTSRWLVEAGRVLNFEIRWRPFSLTILNKGNVPTEYEEALIVSTKALRVITQMTVAEHNSDVFAFYTALGNAWFENGDDISVKVVEQILRDLKLQHYLDACEQEALDSQLAQIHNYAHQLGGEDTGSPILELRNGIGVYGPIFSEIPIDEEAGILFNSVRTLALDLRFSELKRHR